MNLRTLRFRIDNLVAEQKFYTLQLLHLINTFVIIVPSICCTNFNLVFEKGLASGSFAPNPTKGLCPLDPCWGYNPQTPFLAVPLLNSFLSPCIVKEESFHAMLLDLSAWVSEQGTGPIYKSNF